MTHPTLAEIEQRAAARGLVLRLQVRSVLAITTVRVVVARRCTGDTPAEAKGLMLLGELKGWALPSANGLRLDTMRVQGEGTAGVGNLIWAATFAWALEATPCRRATILAIRDNDHQHRRLVRYFKRVGFTPQRELGASLLDLGPRLIWGGAGLLMQAHCNEGLRRSSRQLA